WPYPKSDLFHWIPVLNRFDLLLESAVRTFGIGSGAPEKDKEKEKDAGEKRPGNVQSVPFDAETKEVLEAVLRFTRCLWENCGNRNLYNSYEHLSDLLYTSDIDILEATLRLLLRPAQRLNPQRSLRVNFALMQERLAILAQNWGTKEYGLELPLLASSDPVDIPSELHALAYQFYRSSGTGAGSAATASPAPRTPARTPTSSSADGPIRIRVAVGIASPDVRRKLVIVRLLAIAIYVNVVTEDVAQTKLFLYEPDLCQKIADLLQPERNISFDIQTAAIYALDCIAHYRGRLGEVLTALNASANHGALMYTLRKII
ncbi:hypothetical protein BDK51DRAFT_2244, partial [Blyttiomyces helicus]